MVNLAALDDLEKWIDEQHALPPEKCRWNQNFWRLDGRLAEFLNTKRYRDEKVTVPDCGSAFCAAGHVAWKAGAVWPPIDPAQADSGAYVLYDTRHDTEPDPQVIDGYRVMPVYARAETVLGIDLDWSDPLFDGANSYDTMKTYLAAIRAGKTYDEWYDEKYCVADDAE